MTACQTFKDKRDDLVANYHAHGPKFVNMQKMSSQYLKKFAKLRLQSHYTRHDDTFLQNIKNMCRTVSDSTAFFNFEHFDTVISTL